MKLTYEGIRDRAEWEKADFTLPAYDPAETAAATREAPVWVHFGIGNIFRIFIGGIADRLLADGYTDRGITCAETFDFDVVDRIYDPFDNLVLAVTLHADGRQDKRILGSLTEAVKATVMDQSAWNRMKEIFISPSLQMVSFTITEKGYALRDSEGNYLPYVLEDLKNGPGKVSGAMGTVTSLLYERYKAGGDPIAFVSMDNVSHNGEKLKASVTEIAGCWRKKGFTDTGFIEYLEDESRVSFPWTMIDKITPRPGESISRMLAEAGVEDMDIIVTSKKTYIAPFANAEGPEYLVVEDSFPNGRPPLEKAGVYMTDRDTVNKSERMKVTVCLNPIHTAVCTFARMLGYEMFADAMADRELSELAHRIGYTEGLPVVEDPGIISPQAFLDELMTERFPNVYLGDTSARIAVDISQMVGIRFGETIKAYTARDGDASGLTAIPLAIAGWVRYLTAVDDSGKPMELSPDPMLPELTSMLSGMAPGDPDSLGSKLRPLLANERVFGSDLYAAGIGNKIEEMVKDMLMGPGAVRAALRKYLFT
ncbi:MAG: mannitol dehydrogenase family protein [Mogibacterium sp.]|nr:mannitol dehydrogenase family protein [Mogibacterium sp.]